MHEIYLNSTRDALLIGIPFIAILAFGVFRLDTIFFASQKSKEFGRCGCGVDESGEPILVDPDGKPSLSRSKR